MFTSEVQFGHAGACANAEEETADAKNMALLQAGALVPDSFDTLGVIIRYVSGYVLISPCKGHKACEPVVYWMRGLKRLTCQRFLATEAFSRSGVVSIVTGKILFCIWC